MGVMTSLRARQFWMVLAVLFVLSPSTSFAKSKDDDDGITSDDVQDEIDKIESEKDKIKTHQDNAQKDLDTYSSSATITGSVGFEFSVSSCNCIPGKQAGCDASFFKDRMQVDPGAGG